MASDAHGMIALGLGVGNALGTGAGVALGAITGDLPFWLGLGIGLGSGVGTAGGVVLARAKATEKPDTTHELRPV